MAVRYSATGQDLYTITFSKGSQSQWSVTGWWKISTQRTSAYSGFWGVDTGSNTDQFFLGTSTDGVTLITACEGSGGAAGIVLTVGKWYFCGVSVNGASGTLIVRAIDAAIYTTQTWSNLSSTTTDLKNFRIGNTVNAGSWLNGCVVGVKVWSGVTLTANELQNEAWSIMPRRVVNLSAWYPLLKPETPDYSGNGYTLSGGSGAVFENGPGVSWGGHRNRIVLPGTASYNLTSADSIVASETPASSASLHQPPADSLVASESLARGSALSRVPPDALTTSDVGSRTTTAGRLLTDALTDTDISAGRRGDFRAVSDALTDSEVAGLSRGGSRSPQDDLASTEVLTGGREASRTTPDAANALEVPARTLGDSRGTADASVTTEIPARALGISRPPTDVLMSADVATASRVQARAPGDTLADSDTLAYSRSFVSTDTDSATTSDALADIRALYRSGTEPDGLAETQTRSIGSPRDAADVLAGSEVPLSSTGASRAEADAGSLTETPAGSRGGVRGPADALTGSESTTRATGASETTTDADALGDSGADSRGLVRSPPEASAMAETGSSFAEAARGTGNALAASEAAERVANASRLLADASVESLDLSASSASLRGPIDTLGLADIPVSTEAQDRVTGDALSPSDSGERSAGDTRGTTDPLDNSEAMASRTGALRAEVDAFDASEATVLSVQVFRLAPESLAETDSAVPASGSARTASDPEDIADRVAQSGAGAVGAEDAFDLGETPDQSTTLDRVTDDSEVLPDIIESAWSGVGTADTADTIVTAEQLDRSASTSLTGDDATDVGEAFYSTTGRLEAIDDAVVSTDDVDRLTTTTRDLSDDVDADDSYEDIRASHSDLTEAFAVAVGLTTLQARTEFLVDPLRLVPADVDVVVVRFRGIADASALGEATGRTEGSIRSEPAGAFSALEACMSTAAVRRVPLDALDVTEGYLDSPHFVSRFPVDTASLGTEALRTDGAFREGTESEDVGEDLRRGTANPRLVVEPLVLADLTSRSAWTLESPSDSADFAEAFVTAPRYAGRSPADVVGLGDAPERLTLALRTVGDLFVGADAVGAFGSAKRLSLEILTTGDDEVAVTSKVRDTLDGSAWNDNLIFAVIRDATGVDLLDMEDPPVVVGSYDRTASDDDSLSAVALVAYAQGHSRVVSDGLVFLDYLFGALSLGYPAWARSWIQAVWRAVSEDS